MNATNEMVEEFFERYSKALLARDAMAVAEMYAVPSLIVFPGNVIAVSSTQQTEEFFESSWQQYDGVNSVDKEIVVMAEAPGSVWVDVTWSHDGRPSERMCYQLVAVEDAHQIAVLTPLAILTPPDVQRTVR